MAKIKTVELFAGVGGFNLGLSKSKGDFDVIFSNQWEPGTKSQFAFEALKKNFPKENLSNVDINIAKKDIPNNYDLLVGGFPCQDYSVAATHSKGIKGKKGVLWWQIEAIAAKDKPKYLFLENVDRLLKSPVSQRGRDFAIMLRDLDDLGYNTEWMVINAAEYGFVQRRRRTFILAWKKDSMKISADYESVDNTYKSGIFSEEFKVKSFKNTKVVDLRRFKNLVNVTKSYKGGKFLNYGMCIDGKVICADYESGYTGKHKVLGDILEHDVQSSYFLNKQQLAKVKYLRGSKRLERTRPDGTKYTYAEGAMSEYDSSDKPARTMLTSESSMNRSTHYVMDTNPKTHKKGLRTLTPLEAERIQGFDDNWTAGVMTERQRFFCMGNALVVPLVTKIANALTKKINQK